MTHDKFCIYEMAPHLPESILKMSCMCERFAEVRADEREKAESASCAAQNDAYVCGRTDEKDWAALRVRKHLNAENSVYDLADIHIEAIIAAARGGQ